MTMISSRPTPMAPPGRTSSFWRSGRRGGPPAVVDPPAPPRRGRDGRCALVGSSPSSKNDTRWLLAVRPGQYDRADRRCALLQLCRQGRTAGRGRRTTEAVKTADDPTEELDA